MNERILDSLISDVLHGLKDLSYRDFLSSHQRTRINSLINSDLYQSLIKVEFQHHQIPGLHINNENEVLNKTKDKFVPDRIFDSSTLFAQVVRNTQENLTTTLAKDDWAIFSKFPQLQDELTLQREPSGIVHIQAENDRDLFFGLGLIHAQDRLWQMDYQRRIATGRLAEILGAGGTDGEILNTDIFIRTLGIAQAAEAAYQNLSPETKQLVDSYTAGINAYLDLDRPLPVEFQTLGYEPEPWQPSDVMALVKLQSLGTSSNFGTELLFAALQQQGLSFERIQQLFPTYEGDVTILRPEDVENIPGLPLSSSLEKGSDSSSIDRTDISSQSLETLANVKQLLAPFAYESNNWVVSGEHTETGKPFLANDIHLPFQTPSVWHSVDLQSPNFNSIGASFPGIPAVVVGHNDRIAWGLSTAIVDQQDLYALVETPDGQGYIYQGEFHPYQTYQETIKVRGGEDIVITVRDSIYGPVISDALGIEQPLALNWVSLSENDGTLESFLNIDRADNWEDFTNGLESFNGASTNFVYADVDGNIGYYTGGLAPIRQNGDTGLLPVPGTGEFDWQGFIPFEQMPQIYNPDSGVIVTANNRITPSNYPYYLSSEWAEPYRAERIQELLASKEPLSIEDMQAIQLDRASLLYRDFKPILEEIEPILKQMNPRPQTAISWLEKLLHWDGNLSPESREATVFETWYSKLLLLPKAELGRDFISDFAGSESAPRFILHALQEGDPVCGSAEDCLAKAARAFVRVMDSFSSGVPRWGEVNQASFAHPFLPIDLQVPFGGDRYTVNAAVVSLGDSTTYGVNYRQIVDLGDLQDSLFIQPPGQSGNPFSPYFDNLLGMWQRGEYLPMLTEDFPVAREITLEGSDDYNNLVFSEGVYQNNDSNFSAENLITPFFNPDSDSATI